MNQLIEPYPKIRIPKKGPESLHHPDGQGPLSGIPTDPGNNPPLLQH